MDKTSAVQDFIKRIEHYREHYEELEHEKDNDLSYIQIFNQGERFMVHKLAGKIIYIFFYRTPFFYQYYSNYLEIVDRV